MRKLSQVETACLLAFLIIFAIGCEKQRKSGHAPIPRADSVVVRTVANTVKVDTDYYPCDSCFVVEDDMGCIKNGREILEHVSIAMYPIYDNGDIGKWKDSTELQPGY